MSLETQSLETLERKAHDGGPFRREQQNFIVPMGLPLCTAW